MTMSVEILAFVAQAVLTVLSLLGVAFALGKLYGRIDALCVTVAKVEVALFGAEGKPGMFLRNAEAELMLKNAALEHAEFDRRLQELAERVSVVEKVNQ